MAKTRPPMSQRAYARHRGVSLKAVQKAIATGRIQTRRDGKIDAQKADAAWTANAARPTHERAAPRAPVRPGEPATLQEAKRQEAIARTQALRIATAERAGRLVRVDEAERVYMTNILNARNKLLAIPTRLKQRRPHLTLEDLAVLDALIRESLEELADGRAEAAS